MMMTITSHHMGLPAFCDHFFLTPPDNGQLAVLEDCHWTLSFTYRKERDVNEIGVAVASQAEPRVRNAAINQVDAAVGTAGSSGRAKRLAKKENGQAHDGQLLWRQMSKCLGPRRSRKLDGNATRR